VTTLNYATRASHISNDPHKNVDPKIQLINELKEKNKLLCIELNKANDHIAFLTSLTNEKLKIFGKFINNDEDLTIAVKPKMRRAETDIDT
jgi:hypothetical protein